MTEHRMKTAQAVHAAQRAWLDAPAHYKAMAGAYVRPLVEALMAINSELNGPGPAQRCPHNPPHCVGCEKTCERPA